MPGPLLTLALLALSPGAPPHAAPPLVIRGVTVVDVRSGGLVPGRSILVREGRIEQVATVVQTPVGATVIDGAGLYVMPGLADMHVHLEEDDLALLLANGITTARDMNGSPETLGWREEVRRGTRRGPTLFVASPLLSGDSVPFHFTLIRNPDEAKLYAEQYIAEGYDLLKVYDGLSPESYMAIVTTAREHSIPVAGHIPDAVGVQYVIGHGQASIEHAEQIVHSTVDHKLDLAGVPPIVAMFAGHQTAVTPTLAAAEILSDRGSSWFPTLYQRPEMRYAPTGIRGWWNAIRRSGGAPGPEGGDGPYIAFQRALTLGLWKAGVPILVGTDTPNPLLVPGFSLLHEMQALERAGLPRAAVLRAATLGAAEHLRVADSVGTIAVGQRADIVLLGANPLDDLGAVRQVRGVVVRGEWLERSELDSMLAAVAGRRGAYR